MRHRSKEQRVADRVHHAPRKRSVQSDSMIDLELAALLHRRLRSAPSPSTVSDSQPVLFFGDLFSAQAVTVGLNPSDQEYLDRHGVLLTGRAQRFASLTSLGARSRMELTDAPCDEALGWMRDYSDPEKPAYGSWFNSCRASWLGSGAASTPGAVARR
jgi:hypothetical protein